MQIHLA